jgi:hypothetical protein
MRASVMQKARQQKSARDARSASLVASHEADNHQNESTAKAANDQARDNTFDDAQRPAANEKPDGCGQRGHAQNGDALVEVVPLANVGHETDLVGKAIVGVAHLTRSLADSHEWLRAAPQLTVERVDEAERRAARDFRP